MSNFNSIKIEIEKVNDVVCQFYEHQEENILKVEITGKCCYGSRGENYGQYFVEKIGLALLKVEPTAVLIDLRDLEYEFGDRIYSLFHICAQIDKELIVAYVLSDKNKHGLSSLFKFELEKPRNPFYYDYDKAYQELYDRYDKI